jgi:hypothetical protein
LLADGGPLDACRFEPGDQKLAVLAPPAGSLVGEFVDLFAEFDLLVPGAATTAAGTASDAAAATTAGAASDTAAATAGAAIATNVIVVGGDVVGGFYVSIVIAALDVGIIDAIAVAVVVVAVTVFVLVSTTAATATTATAATATTTTTATATATATVAITVTSTAIRDGAAAATTALLARLPWFGESRIGPFP